VTDPAALLTRLEEATQSRDVWKIALAGQALEHAATELAARVLELEAENARLREGLKPFADVAKVHHINIQHINNDAIVHEWMDAGQSFQLTVGDFRKARAALKGGEI
jgi:hypothetical protein